RRCFAFSLAFRLFARIVLLDLTVLFTWGSDLDAAALSYLAPPTLAKVEPRVGGGVYGPGEGQLAGELRLCRSGECRIARGDGDLRSKAFVKESEDEADLPDGLPVVPAGLKNYMTPRSHRHMEDELRQLLRVERPKVVETVAWAAGNGDRSENGDYIYG